MQGEDNIVFVVNTYSLFQKLLDYEVDSDEEWEEEQEGESVGGSIAGSDEEPEGDEYEVDNVVFVPHGYLSDEVILCIFICIFMILSSTFPK